MSKEHILVIEDEDDIQELVRYTLLKEGFRVTIAGDGESGVERAREGGFDLVLLDLMLPGIDGMEVCRILQGDPRTSSLPVIMITARSEESDVVTGLRMGAEDYVTKPFSPKVLLARIRNVFRRRSRHAAAEEPVKVGDLLIHPGRHEVTLKGRPLTLTPTEFGILHFLASKPGWVFSREQIVDGVKGTDYPVTDRSVDVQMVNLRRKLGRHADLLETVRGVGYRCKET
ncbi:MAG: response regulator transcription factor [Lentisphaerae bacterium]|nr:response regulator transcription factor [Lentisphaerota bacterium]